MNKKVTDTSEQKAEETKPAQEEKPNEGGKKGIPTAEVVGNYSVLLPDGKSVSIKACSHEEAAQIVNKKYPNLFPKKSK